MQPKENLTTGWHSLELKVMGENSEGKIFCKSIYYRFEERDQYFCGVVPSELQTIKHVNGVKKTQEGLGLPEYIHVYGAGKKTTFAVDV